jgi:glutathione-regulated potassium-efflux system ancillary protein KefF
MIVIIYAHPYPHRSRLNQAILSQVSDLSDVEVRSLYELYPNLHIDVQKEQEALAKAHTVVIQHPLYWYHTPALLTLWFEKVLSYGWAYGKDKDNNQTHHLKGKSLLWTCTTGASEADYSPQGVNLYTMDQVAIPLKMVAKFCEMKWLDPFIVHHGHLISDADLQHQAHLYRQRMLQEADQL